MPVEKNWGLVLSGERQGVWESPKLRTSPQRDYLALVREPYRLFSTLRDIAQVLDDDREPRMNEWGNPDEVTCIHGRCKGAGYNLLSPRQLIPASCRSGAKPFFAGGAKRDWQVPDRAG